MFQLACPLCGHFSGCHANDGRRTFFQCTCCELVFADPRSRLDPKAERAVYDLHENDPEDARYRRFLDQLARPLLSRLDPGMDGLDYGCGPGPTLSVMLEGAGMRMQLYDPHFAADPSVLDRRYDFVTCSEVAEHFYEPARDWAQMVDLVRPGGWLGIMTRLVDPRTPFDRWYYKNDPTHVSFYSSSTIAWVGTRFGLKIEHQDGQVVLFIKTDQS